MGVNLVPEVRDFKLLDRVFVRLGTTAGPNQVGDGSVEDGCITEGPHRVLRFDFYCKNIGDQDLVIGDPSTRRDLYKFDDARQRWILKDPFNIFSLKNGGTEFKGQKVVFCLEDEDGGEGFDCFNQGISAGNHDLYEKFLPCNFIQVDGIVDGDYTFETITNATSVKNVKAMPPKAPLIPEDNYDDNKVTLSLRITGNNVQVIP